MMIGWGMLAGTALVVALTVLPIVAKLGYVLDVLFYVFVYIILGQGFNVLAGFTGLVSLGQAAFFGTGALVGRWLWIAGMPFGIAMIAGGFAAALLSAVIGIPCLRLRGAYFSIGTLALTIISFLVTSNVFISESFLPPAHMAAYSIYPRYYAGLALTLAAIFLVHRLARSRVGMGMVAIREDEDAARSIGIPVFRRQFQALIISAFTTGTAGGLYAFYQAALYYHQSFSPLWSFDPILVTFIGGSGTLFGPVLGAVFYVVLKEIFALTIGAVHVVVFGIIFMLVVLFFPRGLADIWQRIVAVPRARKKAAWLAVEVGREREY